MTPLNTIIEEEKKEFEARFCNERICKCCLNKECNHSTTGCPWYQNDVFLHTDNAIQIKAFLTTAMQRAYEAGREERDTYWKEMVRKETLQELLKEYHCNEIEGKGYDFYFSIRTKLNTLLDNLK